MVPRVEPKGAPEMCTDPAEVSPVRYQEIKNFDDETVKGQLLIQLRGASSYRGTYSSLRAEDLPMTRPSSSTPVAPCEFFTWVRSAVIG